MDRLISVAVAERLKEKIQTLAELHEFFEIFTERELIDALRVLFIEQRLSVLTTSGKTASFTIHN